MVPMDISPPLAFRRIAARVKQGVHHVPRADVLRRFTRGCSPKDMKCDLITDAQDYITKEAVAQSATNLVEAGSILIVVRSGILQHKLPVAVALQQSIRFCSCIARVEILLDIT